uniref:Cytochrome b5 heme-binding domain-containing protein n=1 Tax=Amphimedon queenslandica TaxID=400682 RepID=A0A1X7URQ1_AMPQE
MGSPDPGEAYKKFTYRELRTLNRRENAHVAYKGKVYDVSGFVLSHPGGIDQIMIGAGHDITQLFNTYHQPKILKVLEKYYVGELIDNEMPVYAEDKTQFYPTLKKRVKEKLNSLNIDPKFDYRMFALYLMVFITWWGSLYGMLKWWAESWLLSIASTVVLGWISACVIFLIGHDVSHFAVTHSPWVWRAVRIVGQVTSGLSMYCWTYQHIFGHHSYTSVDGVDPDVYTTDHNDVYRLKERQKWIRTFRLQYIYMPVLYSLLTMKMKIQDCFDVVTLRKGPISMNPLSTFQIIEFIVIKLLHVVLLIFVPLMYMSFSSMVMLHLLYELVYGFILAIIININHVNTDLHEMIKPEEAKDIKWAEYQVLTTKDYDTDSLLCTLLTGALNHQVAHHLFPDVLQSYYPIITPIVRDTCKEFGIQYNCEASLPKALWEHLKYLFRMGQEPTQLKVQ